MKKNQIEEIPSDIPVADGKRAFFFPREDRTIMAGSMAEAMDILAKEKAMSEQAPA